MNHSGNHVLEKALRLLGLAAMLMLPQMIVIGSASAQTQSDWERGLDQCYKDGNGAARVEKLIDLLRATRNTTQRLKLHGGNKVCKCRLLKVAHNTLLVKYDDKTSDSQERVITGLQRLSCNNGMAFGDPHAGTASAESEPPSGSNGNLQPPKLPSHSDSGTTGSDSGTLGIEHDTAGDHQ